MERSVYRALLLFGGTVLAIWAFGLILFPFLVPIGWALCLGAVTARPYAALVSAWGRPRLASAVMVLCTGIVVLGPLIGIGLLVLQEARGVDFTPTFEDIEANFADAVESIGDWATTMGYIEKPEDLLPAANEAIRERLPGLLSGPVQGAITGILAPFWFLFDLLLTLVTLYFVYRESGRLRRLALDLSPLEEGETDLILETLRGTTAAAIMGNLLVALIQGALGGAAFAVAGINAPVLWSIVMAGFSFLPFGGTALVWGPAGVYLLLTGDVGHGWFVLIWGTVVVGGSDNLLRPWLLTKTGAKDIHPLLLFFAILSGIGLFGISGIVFGPLLLALLTTVVQIYRQHFSQAARRAATTSEA